MLAWSIGQHFDVAENVAARKISAAGSAGGIFPNHFDHPAIDDVDGFTLVARAVNGLVRRKMAHLRKRAEGLELDRLEGSAESEEIAIGHLFLTAGLVQENSLIPAAAAGVSAGFCWEAFGG